VVLKWAGVVSATVGCSLALSGCTVPPGGIVGVTVDAQGKPVIVVQMCEGHIDGATLYLPDPDPDRIPPQDKTMGSWEVASPVTGFSQFRLDAAGNGWRLVSTLEPRDPETRYSIYGWSKDNSWSANHLHFSERELVGLEPGSVRVPSEDPESEDNRTESLEDFRSKTCQDW
jgi:hypothetical protein